VNGDNKLDSSVTGFPVAGIELRKIMDTTVPSSERAFDGRPLDGSIHVYYVKELTEIDWGGFSLGYLGYVFMPDIANTYPNILAHEVGHALGLDHNADGCSKTTNACTTNPYGLNPNDSELTDRTSLMWWLTYKYNWHLTPAHWKRLIARHR